MPQWFIRGLRRGVVTTRYPAGQDASAASLPTPPAFRQDELTKLAPERAAPRPLPPPNPIGRGAAPGQLIVADLLVSACPSGALRRDGDELVFDVGACTACGECRRAAPAAVVASGEFELAATARSALVKRISLGREVAT
jgi:ferredoxin